MPVARRPDLHGLVGEAHDRGLGVGGRVDRDGLDAELAAGARDPQGDLAAVGDQDLLEHALPSLGDRLEVHQHLLELDPLAVLHDDLGHLAALARADLVHQLHRLDDADRLAGSTTSPSSTNGFAPGCGRR